MTTKKIVVRTIVRNLPISPRKLRLVVGAVKQKKLTPQAALEYLTLWNKKGARFLAKAIKTVLADAEHNFKLSPDNLVFKNILVNEGIRLKRLDKSHGWRFSRGIIQKRRSHLIVEVRPKNNGTES